MMRARDVLEVVDHLGAAGVRVWLDGGWGVDALIGQQTREHDDLDLVIPLPDGDAARRTLTALGFDLAEDEPTLCFVARDVGGRRVDVHTVTFDGEGGALQRQEDGTFWRYPPESFSELVLVNGNELACLSVETQILCHLNYEPDEMDRRDMELLAGSRNITLPQPYGP
jgi:lincosamide nucleotidyltransferase A/C/D/E